MHYLKINSLWKRQGWYFDQGKKNSSDYQKGRNSLIIGDYAEPEFGNIKKWHVEEKVNGVNIRITYKDGNISIEGRSDDSQLPPTLLNYLRDTFYESLLHKVFPCQENSPYPSVILYGEGYGHKIQKSGGNYRKDVGFILFDALIDKWWLERPNVADIANKLNVPSCPSLGIMTEDEIVEFVKSKPLSRCSVTPQVMEGVVCRSEPLVLFREGIPIMWKLKCKEF